MNINDIHRPVQAPSPSPSAAAAAATTTSTMQEMDRQATNVTIQLSDCMQCYIRIPRCPIPPEAPEEPPTHQASDTQEKETTAISRPMALPPAPEDDDDDKEKEEELHGEEPPPEEEGNPMEDYRYVEIPWPESLLSPSDDDSS